MKWVLSFLLGLFGITVARSEVLREGMPFPAWQLVDHEGRLVTSRELEGKTYLLWFYPKAMTPGCTKEGCELRDNYAEFEKLGVEVLGVSFDTPEDNARFVKAHRFPFRLLSDRDRTLAVQVGAADSPKAWFARRMSYLVGPDGKVLKVYSEVNPSTHARQVLDDVRALSAR